MHNILLLSTIYPILEGNKGTSVCHFFTREWVKMGYNVRVVHVQAVYPKIFYWMARLARKHIAARTGAVVYTYRDNHTTRYELDNVPISRMPVYKPIPHGAFSKKSVHHTAIDIAKDNLENHFVPDVIIGHFPNPQIELLSLLKKDYPQAKTCMVMHGDVDIMLKVYGERLPVLMKDVDMWGFRCKTMIDDFEAAVGKVNSPFICYSGIPSKYIAQKNTHDYSKPLRKFLFVGEMIERKFPEKIIDALVKVYPSKNFELHYVGDGRQLLAIKQKVEEYGLQNQVKLLGWIPRDRIIEEYDNADCMIMISRGEAYGLVYLEAMARGCITIASRNEGFDGVILDGVNGFLCEAGNEKELANIIVKFNEMPTDNRNSISEHAILTAKNLTDEKAAEMYINDIKQRMNIE